MSSETAMTFEQGIKLIEAETFAPQKPPQEHPTSLPLDSIKLAEASFQPRQFEEDTPAKSEDHIRALVEAIFNEPSHTLDPLVVWWSGRSWRVLDGHHRYHAYRRIQKQGKLANTSIPVTVYCGDLYGAMAESSRLNAKDKMPMSSSDKLNRAWKFVVLGKFSKAQISQSCKVGSTSVARMRVTLETVKSLHPNDFQTLGLGMSWEEAQRLGQDEKPKDSSWKDRIIKEWTKRLARGFGTRFATQPELAAAAIESYSDRLPDELIREWWDRVERIREEIDDHGF